MSLTERIDRRQDNPSIVTIVERRIEQPRPVPVWLRRMQDGKLPPKDLTGRVAA